MRLGQLLGITLGVVGIGTLMWPHLGLQGPAGDAGLADLEVVSAFADFRAQFNKSYSSLSEMEYRLRVFRATLAQVRAHNARPDPSYTLGINEFSDLTFQEFSAAYLSSVQTPRTAFPDLPLSTPPPDAGLQRVNWFEKGVVTPVKSMGTCRANYAFAIVAVVEEAYSLFHRMRPPVLSEQELIDCSDTYENQKCLGGYHIFSMYYIRDFGVNSADAYPYKGSPGFCRRDIAGRGPYRPKGWVAIREGPAVMMRELQKQPLTAGMIIKEDFKSYKSGVYDNPECGGDPTYLVNAIGYDTDASRPHFIAKNFWGTSWGEQGFFRVLIAPDRGICGFTGPNNGIYAVIESPDASAASPSL